MVLHLLVLFLPPWLLELPLDAPLGQDVRETLQLDDSLMTVKLTPNLAHCLSVYGVAREVVALTGAPLLSPAFPTVAVTSAQTLPVTVGATDLCGRFSGRIVRNLDPRAPTPQWMVDRLARCGQRSVTALADIFFPRVWRRRATHVPAGTVSMTVYFHAGAAQLAATGTGFVLAQARAQAFRNGFFDQTAQLWNEAGEMLVSSHQIVYYKA